LDRRPAQRRQPLHRILQEPARLDFSGPNAAARLQAYIDAKDKLWGKVLPQKMKEAARKDGLADAYLYYKVLSGDAAHPSVSALDRCVRGRGRALADINWGPDPVGISDTVNCGCQAMLAAGIAITQMLRDTKHNEQFAGHARVYAQLNRT
jgi:hypothetical protein